ncbi:MAG: 4Fe-4S binding protein [Candidatus Schekmanbacteria bacterium]|nr:4Fe-4S binding protein [Candidatus Schekmanbacteria bacterium]
MIELRPAACNGCGACVKVCPHGVLAMEERKARLVAEERCIECGACQLNCHEGAVQVTKGAGCIVYIVLKDILGLDADAILGAPV